MNQGSIGIQWPPTPMPGLRILTRGCLLARLIAATGSMSNELATEDNSFANAMFTSLYVFSINLTNSAVTSSVNNISPFTNEE